jgi:quercetin dioxygenase-like cupin family protein
MAKFNIDKVTPSSGTENYFVGKARIRAVINESVTKDVEVSLVSFEDGARTKIHYHDSDQVLVTAEGEGVLAVQTKVQLDEDGKAQVTFGEVQQLKKGDFVCIPAFLWHWHGAKKGENFSHYQIKRPCKTVWLE